MEYDIKLYVHGVPSEGQQVWGSVKDGQSYIENFYGRKSSVTTQLITENIPLNGNNCCYYTYLRGNDIIGRDGRAGSSYFALTLCMSHLYTDLINLYNVLDASFNKFIVGSVLKQVSGNYAFITSDFNQHDTLFKDLEKEIIHYLMQFSSNSDFLSTSRIKNISSGRISNINIFECNSQVAFNQINLNGGVSISPYYPSVQVANILKQKDVEIDNVKQQSMNQIADIKEQCNLQIHKAETDRDNGIRKVEEKYANSATEISSLKNKLQEALTNCQNLKATNEDLEKQINRLKQLKAENERNNEEIERLNNLISKVKSHLTGLSEIANYLGVNVGQVDTEKTKNKYNSQRKTNKKRDCNEEYKLNIKQIIIVVSSLFILFIGVFFIKGCFTNSKNDLTPNIENVVLAEQEPTTEIDDSVKEVPNDNPMERREQFTITVASLQNLYPNIRIDISGISSTKPMRYESDVKYIASLKGIDKEVKDLGGIWESEDFSINGNQITPKHTGGCIINYVINDTVLVSRNIKVQ